MFLVFRRGIFYGLETETINKQNELLDQLQPYGISPILDEQNATVVFNDVLNHMKTFHTSCAVLYYPSASLTVRNEVVSMFEKMSLKYYGFVKFKARTNKNGYMMFAIEYLVHPDFYLYSKPVTYEYIPCEDQLKELFI